MPTQHEVFVRALSHKKQKNETKDRHSQNLRPHVRAREISISMFDSPLEIREQIYMWAFTRDTGPIKYMLSFAGCTLVAHGPSARREYRSPSWGCGILGVEIVYSFCHRLPVWIFANKQVLVEAIDAFTRYWSFEVRAPSRYYREYRLRTSRYGGRDIVTQQCERLEQSYLLESIRTLCLPVAVIRVRTSVMVLDIEFGPGILDALNALMDLRGRQDDRHVSLLLAWQYHLTDGQINQMPYFLSTLPANLASKFDRAKTRPSIVDDRERGCPNGASRFSVTLDALPEAVKGRLIGCAEMWAQQLVETTIGAEIIHDVGKQRTPGQLSRLANFNWTVEARRDMKVGGGSFSDVEVRADQSCRR